MTKHEVVSEAQWIEACRALLAKEKAWTRERDRLSEKRPKVAQHVTEPGRQVEFAIAMGNWMMFSLLFRNLRIPLAEGVMVWPPDGLVSPTAAGPYPNLWAM